MDINAKRQERARLVGEARGILDLAEQETRDLTGEENASFDRLMASADAADAAIAREEKLRERERQLADAVDPSRERNGPDSGPESARDAAWRQYLVGGRGSLTPEQARSLNAGSDPEGGFLVAPQQWAQELIQAVDDAVVIRPLATKHTLTEAESLGQPSLDTDLDDAEWTSEVGTGSQDDALRLGRRELRPHPVAKRVKISRKLLRLTAGRAENLVRERLAYKFGITEEKAFMTGDGNEKPLGLFTASAMGINTDRDKVIYDVSDAAMLSDGLIDAKFFLKGQYWKNAQWLFHRDAVAKIRKVRNAVSGDYIWQPGLQTGQPDRILDLPYLMSEYVPNTFTAGAYVGMLADLRFYHIADALDMEVQRLVELYAETNQVGFIGRLETDAMPVLSEAFVRLSCQA